MICIVIASRLLLAWPSQFAMYEIASPLRTDVEVRNDGIGYNRW